MSRLYQAQQAGLVRMVGINQIQKLPICLEQSEPEKMLGVWGLSACTVILIASDKIGILSHVGPNVLGATDPDSHITLARQHVEHIRQLLHAYAEKLPRHTTTYIVYATLNGSAASPGQLQTIRNGIAQLGLKNVKLTTYSSPPMSAISRTSAAGTILVDGRGPAPRVYLEDREITLSYWIYRQPKYIRLTAGNVALEERDQPPINEWIVDSTGRKYRWNGSAWEYAN